MDTDVVLMREEKLEIKLLGESIVKNEGWYTDVVRHFDCDLLVAHGASWRKNLNDPDGGPWWQMSRNAGVTWEPYARPDNDHDHRYGAMPFMSERGDGSVIGWAGAWNAEQEYKGRPGQPIAQSVIRAPSWNALVEGQGERVPATIWIPYMVPLVGDDFKTLYTPAIWGKMVDAGEGHLVQAVYPVLLHDQAPRLWTEQKAPAPKYRTCVIYSRDDGVTWHFLATVASALQHPLPAQAEGYCEPDLLHFGGANLLCVMRSGGSPTGTLMERCTPLVASMSKDGGLTWTPPSAIAAYGVKPVLLQMSNGLVACLSGRPGFFLLFSADGGYTWSTPHWVSESHGPWGRSASGYGELIEVEPGVLGVAYDEYVSSGNESKMVTKFRRYRMFR